MKSTNEGYINRNNQENQGKLNEEGTLRGQSAYQIKCLNCEFVYKANGCDIFQRKCPKCQNGRL